MSLIQPDRYFSRTSAINVEWDIVGKGFTHVLLDIDNTILSRADHQVPADVRRWLVRVRAAGVKMCFLSNNFHGNVFDLARELDLPIVAKALKPLPHGFVMARNKIGGTRKNTFNRCYRGASCRHESISGMSVGGGRPKAYDVRSLY